MRWLKYATALTLILIPLLGVILRNGLFLKTLHDTSFQQRGQTSLCRELPERKLGIKLTIRNTWTSTQLTFAMWHGMRLARNSIDQRGIAPNETRLVAKSWTLAFAGTGRDSERSASSASSWLGSTCPASGCSSPRYSALRRWSVFDSSCPLPSATDTFGSLSPSCAPWSHSALSACPDPSPASVKLTPSTRDCAAWMSAESG